ncbi:UNVERIFIED_CONTAM: hypothetical protein Scaly_0074200 [Sesamum calycinum]|uniref:DUF4283 domain-containing protein n=1 Tax=Sesamum calycinum TaxID=2727403 RepID=A0AAW2SWQ6_9LAMI
MLRQRNLRLPIDFLLSENSPMEHPHIVICISLLPDWAVQGAFTVSMINAKHPLISLSSKSDYSRLWLQCILFLQGFPMRIFKWMPTFTLTQESSVVPLWVCFPELPSHFFVSNAPKPPPRNKIIPRHQQFAGIGMKIARDKGQKVTESVGRPLHAKTLKEAKQKRNTQKITIQKRETKVNRFGFHSVVSNISNKIWCLAQFGFDVQVNPRRALWEELKRLSLNKVPWIVGVDFNTMLHTHENRGGTISTLDSIEDFNDMVLDRGLTDAGFEEEPLTWSNKRGALIQGYNMYRLQQKLYRLKDHLRQWNRDIFGNVFSLVDQAKAAANKAEKQFYRLPSEANLINLNRQNTALVHALNLEYEFWRQKSNYK